MFSGSSCVSCVPTNNCRFGHIRTVSLESLHENREKMKPRADTDLSANRTERIAKYNWKQL